MVEFIDINSIHDPIVVPFDGMSATQTKIQHNSAHLFLFEGQFQEALFGVDTIKLFVARIFSRSICFCQSNTFPSLSVFN